MSRLMLTHSSSITDCRIRMNWGVRWRGTIPCEECLLFTQATSQHVGLRKRTWIGFKGDRCPLSGWTMSTVYHLQQNKGMEGHSRTSNHLESLELSGMKGSERLLLACCDVRIVYLLPSLTTVQWLLSDQGYMWYCSEAFIKDIVNKHY